MKRNLPLISALIFILSTLFIFVACSESGTSTSRYPKPQSDLETCTQCKGNGVCNVCDGKGENSYAGRPAKTCTICGGNGICNLCQGNGRVSAQGNAQSQEQAKQQLDKANGTLNGGSTPVVSGTSCSKCQGTGYLSSKCTACEGTGIDSAWEKTKGKAIHAAAEQACYKCNGTGLKKCFYCNGTGKD